MKYKNIYSAIHNFGHSFTSLENYVDGGHVIDEIGTIRSKGHSIEIDWIEAKFAPESEKTGRIQKSIGYYSDGLERHLSSHNVELESLISLKFCWPAGGWKIMEAVDDRKKYYKMLIR